MKTRRGFTILELLLVLVLVSTVAAVAIPAYFSQADVTLENACVLLAKDVRSAQNRAAFLSRPTRLEFLSDGDGYRVVDAGGGGLVPNPRTDGPFERRYSFDGIFEGVHVVEVDFGQDISIVFDEHGVVAEGGQVTLAFLDERRVVRVEKSSGNVSIQGSSSGWTDLGY